MARLTRKELKKDKFAEGVGHSFEFLTEHRSQVRTYGAIALVVIVIVAGYWIYSNGQAELRAKALADAMHVADGVIGDTPQPPNLNFPTQEEKDAAVMEAYQSVVDQFKGSQEAAIAQLYLAAAHVDKGEDSEATALYEDLLEWAPESYASVAKVALAELYAGQDKMADAERLLREVIDNPTVFVSSEEATLTLGRLLGDSNPEEARKLLEPLRESRTAVSRVAIDELGKIPEVPAAPAESN